MQSLAAEDDVRDGLRVSGSGLLPVGNERVSRFPAGRD